MNYFKSYVTVENGNKVYGKLPKDFVIGFENSLTNEVFFTLLKEVEVPENSDVEMITKEEYDKALEEIKVIELDKREKEYLETISKLEAKKKEDERVKSDLAGLQEASLSADERYKSLIDKETMNIGLLKQYKILQLKELCTNSIYDGFTSESTKYKFGFNELDQTNFTQQLLLVVAAGGKYFKKIEWKTKDTGVVELTAEKFMAVVGEAELHKRTQQIKYWDLESKVYNAKDNEEVISIIW